MSSNIPAIETHPQRLNIINALLAGESARSISQWVTSPTVSHNAICRYRRDKVKPALLRSSKSNEVKKISEETLEHIKDVSVGTRQALDADYITSRITAKLGRLDGAIAETLRTKDFDAYSKLESNDSKAIELLARATLHPGFVTQAVSSTEVTVNTVIVLPNPLQCNEVVSPVAPRVAPFNPVVDIDLS